MAGIGNLGTMTPDYIGKSQAFWRNVIAAEQSRSDKFTKEDAPGKTIGGGIMGAAGGAAAGAQVGSLAGPGYGTAIGGVIGGIVGAAGYAFG